MTNFNLPKFLKKKKVKRGGHGEEFTIESYRRFKDGKLGRNKVVEEEVASVSEEPDAEAPLDVPFDEMELELVPSESDTEYSSSGDDSEQEVVTRSRRYRYRFYNEENKKSKKQDKRSSKKQPEPMPKATYSKDNTCNPIFNLILEVDELTVAYCGNEDF